MLLLRALYLIYFLYRLINFYLKRRCLNAEGVDCCHLLVTSTGLGLVIEFIGRL
jgi:hypothetical protein